MGRRSKKRSGQATADGGAPNGAAAETLFAGLQAQPEFYKAVEGKECPVTMEQDGDSASPSSKRDGSQLKMDSWEQLPRLLIWFGIGAAADATAKLSFSPALTKEQRAQIHSAADALKSIESVSDGAGDERYVAVVAKGAAQKRSLSAAQEEEALVLWKLAKEAGISASRDEVRQQLGDGKLSDALAALWDGPKGRVQQEAVQKLCTAAANGDLTEMKEVMAAHPDVLKGNVRDLSSGGTLPLHVAAAEGQLDAVRALLEAGADVGALNGRSQTALQVAQAAEECDVEAILVQAGAKDTKPDSFSGLNASAPVFVPGRLATSIAKVPQPQAPISYASALKASSSTAAAPQSSGSINDIKQTPVQQGPAVQTKKPMQQVQAASQQQPARPEQEQKETRVQQQQPGKQQEPAQSSESEQQEKVVVQQEEPAQQKAPVQHEEPMQQEAPVQQEEIVQQEENVQQEQASQQEASVEQEEPGQQEEIGQQDDSLQQDANVQQAVPEQQEETQQKEASVQQVAEHSTPATSVSEGAVQEAGQEAEPAAPAAPVAAAEDDQANPTPSEAATAGPAPAAEPVPAPGATPAAEATPALDASPAADAMPAAGPVPATEAAPAADAMPAEAIIPADAPPAAAIESAPAMQRTASGAAAASTSAADAASTDQSRQASGQLSRQSSATAHPLAYTWTPNSATLAQGTTSSKKLFGTIAGGSAPVPVTEAAMQPFGSGSSAPAFGAAAPAAAAPTAPDNNSDAAAELGSAGGAAVEAAAADAAAGEAAAAPAEPPNSFAAAAAAGGLPVEGDSPGTATTLSSSITIAGGAAPAEQCASSTTLPAPAPQVPVDTAAASQEDRALLSVTPPLADRRPADSEITPSTAANGDLGVSRLPNAAGSRPAAGQAQVAARAGAPDAAAGVVESEPWYMRPIAAGSSVTWAGAGGVALCVAAGAATVLLLKRRRR